MSNRCLVFIVTENYFDQFQVAFYSLLKYNDIDFDIIIFYDTKDNLAKVKVLAQKHKNKRILFKKIDIVPYKDIDFFNANRTWGLTPGFRFHLFKLVEYDEVLYIDCDVLITKNILNIFDVKGDIVACRLSEGTSHKFAVQNGFNAGIMLIRSKYLNIKTWKKLIYLSLKFKEISGNQILLNKFFAGKISFADQVLNVTTDLLTNELLEDGKLFHFIGEKKPINTSLYNSFNDYVQANTGLGLLARVYILYKVHENEACCFYKNTI